MREITKETKHEAGGKEYTFQITKMNVLDGAWLMKFATEKVLPLLAELDDVFTPIDNNLPKEKVDAIVEKRTKLVFQKIPTALASLKYDDLVELITRCLHTVSVLMPAGWQPMMIGNNFGVEELECETAIGLILCYEVFEFNLGSFFEGKRLGSILQGLNISKRTT